MKRIEKIEIRFPNFSEVNKKENELLFRILSQLKNLRKEKEDYISNIDSNLLPRIIFKKSNINNPQISFITQEDIKDFWQMGNFLLGFNLPIDIENENILGKGKNGVLKDEIGEYVQLPFSNVKYYAISLEHFFEKFNGKLVNLNHVGFNFGPAILPEQEYFSFRKLISEKSNLYRYPTGEEWPFIIPSTNQEFENEITDETIMRKPKFEFAYAKYNDKPTLQLDIETSLSKEEIYNLLPYPYEVIYKELIKVTRSVYVLVDWLGVFLRVDLRFKSTSKDFGYWMIKEGGRM